MEATIFPEKLTGFVLPLLPYAFNALEPFIDAETMELHHDKHHQAYVNNLNANIKGTAYENETLENILIKGATLPQAVRNNAGGHYNHSLFWELLKPGINTHFNAVELLKEIEVEFGSVHQFEEAFEKEGLARFGSGWVWLVSNKGNLRILTTANQDNPIMNIGGMSEGVPILGLDVWEHAYYFKYQNRRIDYIKAWWNLINWEIANVRYLQSL